MIIVFKLEPTRSLLRKSVQLLKAVASIVSILSLMIAELELTPSMGAREPPTSQSATLWTVTLFQERRIPLALSMIAVIVESICFTLKNN